jgi:hypothetical protein
MSATKPTLPITRDAMEIQRAHDVLLGFILGDVPLPNGVELKQLCLLASALCWVLRHDGHGDQAQVFDELITTLIESAEQRGFRFGKRLDN